MSRLAYSTGCIPPLPRPPPPVRWGTYLFFAALLLLNSAFVYTLVPETRGVPQEEM